ncbi:MULTISPECIES: hypothetical protein [Streptomyces]|uniref:Transmembrane protein n=1 Tax=Streptomyces lycii TaxID=2654337 RepID=A0ABQ7FE03_9ACTN|nr:MULTISPECIES: hypothetical protein [Streptomyces]KAF4406041.1 hypothetical protein GCU69_27025 [Streptomyces lycii]PGH49329.1 hypothetical protein CRI70_18215 [Streptomyces sp. Ru87]
MHMKSAPHLLPEDRPEFDRVLDEALRSAHRRPDLAAVGQRLNAEQLRTMALGAAAAISACAAAEYQAYVKLRDELRRPASGGGYRPGDSEGGEQRGGLGFATSVGEVAEASGAGLIAVFAVLAPVLAGSAAAIFLVIGYVLHALSPDEPMADSIINAGWVFTALTAAAILVAICGLLLTARRDGSGSLRASGGEDRTSEVARAREAWRQALLERGVVPFLRQALGEPAAAGADGPDEGRTPPLGYSRPGFSSPAVESGDEAGRGSTRPTFDSPGFSSPDYGGPDHQPE